MDNTVISKSDFVTVIKPSRGFDLLNLKELAQYRDLSFFLAWRDIKILYAQTILGFAWAMLNPLLQILIFTFVFGTVAKVSTEGIPSYILFSSVAIVPWTYMSQAMTQSSQSLVLGQNMLGKVYFPRILFPLTPVFSKLVDFLISLIIILVVMLYYRVKPTSNMLYLPLFISMMILIPAGVGMWLSSMAIRFRDVKFAMPFIIRMLMYSAPIVYSAASIPEKYRLIYSINPIVGVIEGLRSSLLGTPMPWKFIWPGLISAIFLAATGLLYFKKSEKVFVDVI